MKKIIAGAAVFVLAACAGYFLAPHWLDKFPTFPMEAEKTSIAQQIAASMTLEEQVGQMFLVCVSKESTDEEDITAYGLGGYLFFADYFGSRTRERAAADIASYQDAAAIPMLMAVDEEGGTVVRVSKYKEYRSRPFLSPQTLYKRGGLDKIIADCKEKCQLLLSLGLNVNLAPVCDMTDDEDSFIYPRTLGKGPEETAQYAAAVVKTMNDLHMGSALKHFPGYGGNADTHTGIAKDTRDYEAFVSHDFLPFEAAIDAGVPCVLVSHNIVESMEKGKPASLSKNVHDILRNQLNFDGVIMTDDLIMDGVQGHSKGENIAVTAVKAGNDLLCTSQYQDQIPAVIQAVKDGEISEEQIQASAIRILKWKEKLGLLDEEMKGDRSL